MSASKAVDYGHPARLIVAVLAISATLLTSAAASAAVSRRSPGHLPPQLPRPHEASAIENFAPDQSQFFCRSHVEPGVRAFERRVLAQYPVSRSDGDMRGCDVGGSSEHKDGRAWDWGVDHRIPAQRRAGKSMLKWLFASDSYGNPDAMFRRLGLMYVIWNKRIWGAWSEHWEPYSCSGPTLCHVNHMHFSFGWAGAEEKTSYWTHKVSPVVEPPLPYFGKRGAHRSLQVDARTGSTDAMWLFKGGARYRMTATGVWRSGKGAMAKSDALCTKTPHGWAPTRDGGISVGGDQLQSWGEQWVPLHDTGNGCNTVNHAYRLILTPPNSSTVTVDLPDDSRSNDSGSVLMRFVRIA